MSSEDGEIRQGLPFSLLSSAKSYSVEFLNEHRQSPGDIKFRAVECGVLIRIHFFRIRIQLLKKCESGSSLTKFVKNILMKSFYSCKTHKRNNGGLFKFTFKNWINLQLLAISLHFFFFFNFPSWIRARIHEVKWMQIHADPDPQPWLSCFVAIPWPRYHFYQRSVSHNNVLFT